MGKSRLKNRNLALDAAKFWACIAVVLIHVKFPNSIGAVIDELTEFAVPLFFMVSGYYLYDCENEAFFKKAKRAITKLCVLFAFSATGYMVLNVLLCGLSGELKEYLTEFISPTTYLKFFFLNDTDVFSVQLWFIPASIYAYLFWFKVRQKNWDKILFSLIPVLLLLGTVFQWALQGTRIGTWHIVGNWLFRGIPYVGTGLLFASHMHLLEKISRKKLIFFTIVMACIQYLPSQDTWIINPLILVNYGYAVGIFLIAVLSNSKRDRVTRNFAMLGRNCATTVYVIHMGVYKCLKAFFQGCNITLSAYLMPLLVIFVSLGIALVRSRFIQKYKA